MFLSVALSLWWLDAVQALRGEYPVYYNQSSFSFSGSVGECTLSATYNSYGSSSSSYIGCRRERSTWESQQEFDLQYFELVNVCPRLEWLSVEQQGPRQPNTKENLPEELVWRSCSTSSANCPRWSCQESNGTQTNLTYWTLLNATTGVGEYIPQFKVVSSLSLDGSKIPQLAYDCYRCDCGYWFTSSGQDHWAWDCDYYYGMSNPYERCDELTNSPTMAPTNTTAPTMVTDSPTASTLTPTSAPTVGCTSNLADNVYAGSYYWDSVNNCQTISYCYCDANGTESCKTGWDNIYADPVLYPRFLDACSGYLADCWENDAASISRLLQWYDFDISGNCEQISYFSSQGNDRYCPRCGCSHAELGSRNTTTYDSVNVNDTQYFRCATCDCEYDLDGSGRNVSRVQGCANYDTQNNNDAGDCLYEYTTCQNGDITYDIGSYTQCTSSKDHETACLFVDIDVDGSSPDAICLEGIDFYAEFITWDCDDQDVCSILSDTRSGCFSGGYDVPLAEYDCLNNEWLLDDHDSSIRVSCCDPLVEGNNCNNRTVESYEDDVFSAGCENSGFLGEYYANTALCEYTQRNIYEVTSDEALIRTMWCGDTITYDDYAQQLEMNDTQKLCEMLQVNWQYYTFCDCNYAKFMLRALEERPDLEDLSRRLRNVRDAFTGDWSGRASSLASKWLQFNCEPVVVNQTVSEVMDAQFSCDFTGEPVGFQSVSAASSRFGVGSWLNMVALAAMTLFYNRHGSATMWITLSLLAAVLYTSCNAELDWSYTGNNRLGECTFTGYASSNNNQVCEVLSWSEYEYQNEGVSWDVLVDSCPELKYAGCYTEEQQINQNDLLWGSEDVTCPGCPRCPCNNETDTVRYHIDERYDLDSPSVYIRRFCRRCECVFDADFDAFGWDCASTGDSLQGLSDYPYILNDTDTFCVPDFAPPTPAPTPLSCLTGSTGSGTTDVTSEGAGGSSHCYWQNTTIDHYDDGEPSVCVLDEVDMDLNIYGANSNSHPICQVLAGDDSGCFYAAFDMKVQAYDCALDEWLTDMYRVESTIHCCNDAPYCNNQTTIDAVYADDREVRYQYNMTNYTYQCRSSSVYQEYLDIFLGCEHRDRGVDLEHKRARSCRSGVTKSRPDLCRELENDWIWDTKCDCDRGLFFSKYLNSTYDAWQDAAFRASHAADAVTLWSYSLAFDCGFDELAEGKWFCSGVARASVMFAAAVWLVLVALFSI